MSRSHIILVVIFMLLGLAVLMVEQPFSEPEKIQDPDLGKMFPDFDRTKVTEMTFGSFGGETKLIKKDDKWFVEEDGNTFPADMEAVQKVFDTISDMDAKEVVSKNPSKHLTFQVNSPKETKSTDKDGKSEPFRMGTLGTEVILKDQAGKELVHLFVGKNGTVDFMTTYVRKDGSDAVVLVDGYLKAVFGKGSPAGWKDRVICKIDEKSIKKIALGEGKDQIVLESSEESSASEENATPTEKKSVVWRLTKPIESETDSGQVGRLVRAFKRFLATDYAPELDDPKEYGFDKPSNVVALTLDDGSEVKFIIGAECKDKKNQFYIRKEGDDRIFIIPKYRLDTFGIPLENLKKKSPEDAARPKHKPSGKTKHKGK